jgi:DNA-binding MarR family transcriptional regulator
MLNTQTPPTTQNACNATALRKAARRVTQLYDNALEPCGLRSTQYAILAELERRVKEPPTMRELAEALVLDRSSLGHNLRPLERDGLVALQESNADRRRHHVVLTRVGGSKLRVARRLWQKAQDRFDDVFGKAQAALLRETLMSIAGAQRLTRLDD